MQNIKARIEQLRRELEHHARLYYEKDAPEISDYEYDMLYRELQQLEAAHPEFADPLSRTQRVGGRALDKFEKVEHTRRMDSLTDVFSFEELEHRLRERHTETEEKVLARLDAAKREIPCAGEYDYQIVNSDLDAAYAQLRGLYLTATGRA